MPWIDDTAIRMKGTKNQIAKEDESKKSVSSIWRSIQFLVYCIFFWFFLLSFNRTRHSVGLLKWYVWFEWHLDFFFSKLITWSRTFNYRNISELEIISCIFFIEYFNRWTLWVVTFSIHSQKISSSHNCMSKCNNQKWTEFSISLTINSDSLPLYWLWFMNLFQVCIRTTLTTHNNNNNTACSDTNTSKLWNRYTHWEYWLGGLKWQFFIFSSFVYQCVENEIKWIECVW